MEQKPSLTQDAFRRTLHANRKSCKKAWNVFIGSDVVI